MPLSFGTRLGPYEIVAAIGAGGMGEVYKASDTRLNRIVAIKVLPPHWAADAEMQERFTREAQAVAALSHPHICTLHDIGRTGPQSAPGPAQDGGTRRADDVPIDYLVMEYLEGETLDKRLQRGSLPLDEAFRTGVAIAEALAAAHRDGVVHRDLKPANVMLTPSGPKLLDFGLAKLEPAGRPDSAPPAAGASLGLASHRLTSPGLMIGTLQYMAPEQIEGADADARTDIFAFGAILHEMITGTKAFEGRNRALLIAAIATLELDPLSKLRPGVPAALDHVAKRCLAKDPDDRWQSAHDLALKLRWVAGAGIVATQPAPAARALDKRMSLILAAGVVLLAATALPAFMYWRAPATSEPLQFRVPVAGLSDADIAISPDGELIALVARPNTQQGSSLFVRPVNATTFRRLGGTDDAALPFWSPDSRTIAFVAGGRLKRVDATGGAPKDIAAAPPSFTGGAWNAEGTIVFGSSAGLYRVPAEGGTPDLITKIEKPEAGHFWPSFLPGGRRYVYLAWSVDPAQRALMVGALGSAERTRLVESDSRASYADPAGSAAPGYLLFQREGTLFARAFDPGTATFTADPVHLADQVGFTSANGHGHFAVSQTGVLLYFQRPGTAAGVSGRGQTVPNTIYGWSDRTGRQLALAGEQATYGDMDLSPDGRFVAVTRVETGPGADIWVIDWERAGVSWRLTLDPSDDINPVWAPAGDRIAFTTFRNGNADVYVKNANGIGDETPILNSPANEFVEDWSKDGRYLAYRLGTDTSEDIYVLPLTGGDAKPMPVVTGPFRKDEPQFSDDGNWLAYTSNESGMFEVYVVSFPALDQKVRISAIGGGGQPRWRGDGKEIYYRGPDGAAMVADLKVGARIDPGVPRRLFPAHFGSPTSRDPVRHQWSVTADGQRFVVRLPPSSAAALSGSASGRAGTVPFVAQSPTAGTAGAASGQGIVYSGLTVIRNWPAAAGRAVR